LFSALNEEGRKIIIAVLVLVAFFSLNSMFVNYFVLFPKQQSDSFQYALSQSIKYALLNEDQFDRIIFSNEGNLYQSYMFYLYHSKLDPLIYQNIGPTISGGYAQTHKIGKYEFRPVDMANDLKEKVLVFDDIKNVNQNCNEIFNNLDNIPAICSINPL